MQGITRIENDIGLLKLHEALEWTPKISPKNLEMVPREFGMYEMGTIVGWGLVKVRLSSIKIFISFYSKLQLS